MEWFLRERPALVLCQVVCNDRTYKRFKVDTMPYSMLVPSNIRLAEKYRHFCRMLEWQEKVQGVDGLDSALSGDSKQAAANRASIYISFDKTVFRRSVVAINLNRPGSSSKKNVSTRITLGLAMIRRIKRGQAWLNQKHRLAVVENKHCRWGAQAGLATALS